MTITQIIEWILIPVIFAVSGWLINSVLKQSKQTTENELRIEQIKTEMNVRIMQIETEMKNKDKCNNTSYSDLVNKIGTAVSRTDYLTEKLNESDKQIVKLDTKIEAITKSVEEIKQDNKDIITMLNTIIIEVKK